MEGPVPESTAFMEPLPIDWENRCKILEGQLEKFKTQAAKIRDTIGQQVKHLKWQAETSEAAASRASQKVKDLESSLAAKDEEIRALERKVEDEKQRSNYREKQVEEKSRRIKDWMAKKVEQYENEIKELRAQNAELQISRDKALDVVQEMQVKLKFSEGQVLRLSRELSSVHMDHDENDYYVLEPEDPSDSSDNEMAPSQNHVATPEDEITSSQKYIASSQNNMTSPKDETSFPNHVMSPKDEMTSSQDNVTSPPNERTSSLNDVTSSHNEVTSPTASSTPMIVTTTPTDTAQTFFDSDSNTQLYASVNLESIFQEAESYSDREQPVEINIKRTSSGKSPSKIPRYVGNVKDHRGQVSYYMSLKKGASHSTEKDSKPRFFIQIQDNPYMTLMPGPSTPGGSRSGSQSTMDSEHEGGFDSYPNSPDETLNGLTAQTGNVVTLTIDTRNISKDGCDKVTLNTSSVDSLESTVDPNPIYQVLEQPSESEIPRNSPVEEPTAISGTPRNSPTPESETPRNSLVSPRNVPFSETPIVPPRFLGPEQVARPPVPPVPKYRKPDEQSARRMSGGFTSYLLPEGDGRGSAAQESDVPSDAQPVHIDSAIIAEQLKQQAWGWNEGRTAGTDSPQYATLEDSTKNMNMLQEKTCPVYATLKGRASQIRDVPFSGESTDSSDDNRSSLADYCEPPDDDSDGEMTSEKVLKTCATYTTVSLKKEDQHKEGYLTKLGGRVKNWKRRWFVLQDGKLYYYKTPSDVNRKPLGQIPLDGTCRIARTEGAVTFQIATPKRTYHLTADSTEVVIEWLRVLHNVMRTLATTPLFAQVKEKEVMRGWVTKSKHGVCKKCWCVLRGKFLCFYKLEDDAVPFSMMDLADMTVEEFETEDGDAGTAGETQYRHYALVLKTRKHAGQTFLLVDSKPEKDTWLYHLRLATGGNLSNAGTEFEQLVSRIVEDNNQSDPDLWNSPLLTFSKDAITEPLTSLPSKELAQEAVKLFKSILLFTKALTDEAAIDYHVSLVQNALQVCLDHPDLQNEIYCQLIKQTSKHVYNGPQDLNNFLQNCAKKSSWLRTETVSSNTSECQTIDLRPVQSHVFIQAWQMLALCTSLFVPKGKFLLYLKAHLNRSRNLKTKQGKYSAYCLRSLERTLANGNREARPSRMEVLSVLLRNPHDHLTPMSIPVYFIDRSKREFGFDGSTTVQEFTASINRITGIRDVSQSGYAIFTDNPVSPVEHCLQTSVKLCDVISKWEQALRSLGQGRLDSTRIMRLTYKNRLYFKSLQDKEADKEKYFLVFQTNYNIMKGRFAVSKDMALELAALMGQIEYGDYRAPSNSLPSKRIEMVISKYYPKKLRDDPENSERRSLTLRMAEKWSILHGWNVKECVDKYLENARKWPFFGSKVFRAEQKNTLSASKRSSVQNQNHASQPVCLAVEEDSINILEGESLRLMCRYKYRNVVTFGGWKDDFMLVVNQSIMRGGNHVEQGTQRLLFEMSRGKILEITLLMASYINAIVRQQGITCDLSGGPIATKDVKVWDLESSEWPILPGSNVGLL